MKLVDERTCQLKWLSFPVMASVSNLDMWLDEMWSRLRVVDQATDSKLRAELFGVSQAFNAFEESLGGRVCPWVYQIGSETRTGNATSGVHVFDELSIDSVLEVIQTILADVLPVQEGQPSMRTTDGEVEMTTVDADTNTAVVEIGQGLELLGQVQTEMRAAHTRLLESTRQFFEALVQRIGLQVSDTRHGSMMSIIEHDKDGSEAGDIRQRLLASLLEDK